MTSSPVRTFALVLLAAAAAPGLALADPASTGSDAAATAPAPATAAPATATPAHVDPALERRISAMRETLAITPAQEPAWNSFIAVMRDNAADLDARLAARKQNFGGMNAPDDLRSYAAFTSAQATDVGKLVDPFDTLYAALSPAQKTRADTLFHRYAARGLKRHAG